MAGYGLTNLQIAHILGIGKDTFYRMMDEVPDLRLAIDRGVALAAMNVTQKAYQMAISGQSPSMTIFWLKTRCRWKDVSTPGDQNPGVTNLQVNVLNMSNKELLENVGQAQKFLAYDPALADTDE